FKCSVCGMVTCSHNCGEHHFKSAHPVLVEQQKQAKKNLQHELKNLAHLQTQDKQRKELLNVLLSKKKNLDLLGGEADKTTKVYEQHLDAWQQAGSPEIPPADLDRAKEEAGRV